MQLYPTDMYQAPFNDVFLEYDFEEHKYFLNKEGVVGKFGNFPFANVEEWENLRKNITENVYMFIYLFKSTRIDYDHMEYELAKNQYFREGLINTLLAQYEYAITTGGDLVQLQHAFVPTENNIISPDKLRNQLMISMKGYAELKKRGMWFACADMEGELMYRQNLTGSIGLVIGNEGNGVSRLVREHCDYVTSIPMKGDIDSLNASVAAGVLAYEIVRQRMNS